MKIVFLEKGKVFVPHSVNSKQYDYGQGLKVAAANYFGIPDLSSLVIIDDSNISVGDLIYCDLIDGSLILDEDLKSSETEKNLISDSVSRIDQFASEIMQKVMSQDIDKLQDAAVITQTLRASVISSLDQNKGDYDATEQALNEAAENAKQELNTLLDS